MTISEQMAHVIIFYFWQVFVYCRCNDEFFRYIRVLLISDKVNKISAISLKHLWKNSFLMLCPTLSNLLKNTPQIFSRTLLKLSELLFCRESLWLVLLDKHSRYMNLVVTLWMLILRYNMNRYYEHCINPLDTEVFANLMWLRGVDWTPTAFYLNISRTIENETKFFCISNSIQWVNKIELVALVSFIASMTQNSFSLIFLKNNCCIVKNSFVALRLKNNEV